MVLHNSIWALQVLVAIIVFATGQAKSATPEVPEHQVSVPPTIIDGSAKEIVFKKGGSIELPCVATGVPEPRYHWTLNNRAFDPSGTDDRVVMKPGVGTLVFARPIEQDEAFYQCWAENNRGTALSEKVHLRMAYLDTFPQEPLRFLHVDLSDSVTLQCTPPRSYPAGTVYWAVVRTDINKVIGINNDNRVTMDPIGNLHLVNVLKEDDQYGMEYVCMVKNIATRQLATGSFHRIVIHKDVVTQHEPRFVWFEPDSQVALLNQTWRAKCIAAGYPTPQVTWRRIGGELPDRAHMESYGQELVIDRVQNEDQGEYECQAINSASVTPIMRTLNLKVEAAPYWTRQFTSVNATENGSAVFKCEVGGKPEPDLHWFINGVPISDLPEDPRRVIEGNMATFHNVNKLYALVLQCNATNKHGYVFGNAYLNILDAIDAA